MTLTGGKRKANKSLKAWVTFVKKVQKEEKLSYKDAIHRAKIRKDKGEKWMTGGEGTPMDVENTEVEETPMGVETTPSEMQEMEMEETYGEETPMEVSGGGRRRKRRTMKRARGRSRTAHRTRGRARGRGRSRASRRS